MTSRVQYNRFRQLDAAQAWDKIRHFCSYQERCHSEVMEKLNSYGMDESGSAQLASRLVEENFLNEERFAVQFAGGHFRLKKWGKVKIAHALKQKQVSVYCIKKALAGIDEDEYLKLLKKLAVEKMSTLSGQQVIKHFKCKQYLLQKGFEGHLADIVLKEITNEK